MLRSGFSYMRYLVFLLFCAVPIYANATTGVESDTDTANVPQSLAPAFEHLLAYTGDSNLEKPDAQQIDCIIDFINSAKDLDRTYSMGKRKGATSNYYEFALDRSLKDILDLVYNPDIPSHIATPASVRRSEWIRIDGRQKRLPKLSAFLAALTEPVLIKGLEFIENTPDTFSGAYYAYELDRALLLTRHEGHKVLISISSQKNKSNVGKKGLVLGSDDNWNYLYTGEMGCTKTGLGWVKSYMYDSASIIVYYELDGPTPQVRCGVFKWLRAGWAGINMVQPHHIRNGAERFAKNFKNIIESPIMADTDRLTRSLKKINNLSKEDLRRKVKQYYLHLKQRHQHQSRLARQWFDQLSVNDGHLTKMKTEEMKALLEKAYIQHLLGKSPGIDISFFTPLALNTHRRN